MAREIIDPEIGMGGTVQIGSDRYAVTIIAVSRSKREVVIQRDMYRWLKGTPGSEDQEYEFAPNPQGETKTYTRRQDGYFYQKGQPRRGPYLTIGERDAYRDPSF